MWLPAAVCEEHSITLKSHMSVKSLCARSVVGTHISFQLLTKENFHFGSHTYTHGMLYKVYLSQCKGHCRVPLFTSMCVCAQMGLLWQVIKQTQQPLPHERSFCSTCRPVTHKPSQRESTLLVGPRSNKGAENASRKRRKTQNKETNIHNFVLVRVLCVFCFFLFMMYLFLSKYATSSWQFRTILILAGKRKCN